MKNKSILLAWIINSIMLGSILCGWIFNIKYLLYVGLYLAWAHVVISLVTAIIFKIFLYQPDFKKYISRNVKIITPIPRLLFDIVMMFILFELNYPILACSYVLSSTLMSNLYTKIKMINDYDFVEKVKQFNEIAGTPEVFNTRKAALYTGLQLEEMAEKIEAFLHDGETAKEDSLFFLKNLLNSESELFKTGKYDEIVEKVDRIAALDADVDLAVVSLGAGISIGADINGACHNVADSNLSKFPIVDGKYTVEKDNNGKVCKPATYKSPELAPFLRG